MERMKDGLFFISVEQILGYPMAPIDLSGLLQRRNLPVETVLLDKVVSAIGISSWKEPISLLPSSYLDQLTRGEIEADLPVLLKYDGVYIGSGIGNRAIALGKLLGKESILAQVLNQESK